jgi:hypothetical protein
MQPVANRYTDCAIPAPLRKCLPGVKRQGHETYHSPPSIVEVKNGGAIPPLPIRLHGALLS